MISHLRLDEYYTEELLIKTNPSYEPSARQRKEGKLNCSVGLAQAKGPAARFKVGVSVSIEPATDYPALDPYAINIKVVGFFSFQEPMSNEAMQRMASMNGANILLGIARGIVAQVTGTGQFGKYLLPPVNLVEMFKKQADKQPVKTTKTKTKVKRAKVR